MTTSMSMCGKVNVLNGIGATIGKTTRRWSSATATAQTTNQATTSSIIESKTNLRHENTVLQRELFVDVLNANATKRDAKQYLARFKDKNVSRRAGSIDYGLNRADIAARPRNPLLGPTANGVNLGGLYAPPMAVLQAPEFVRHAAEEGQVSESVQTQFHVALVCVRNAETIDDHTLDGLAATLSQLVKLDMRIVVVIDSDTNTSVNQQKSSPQSLRSLRALLAAQALRISAAVERHNMQGCRFVPGSLQHNEDAGSSGNRPVSVEVSDLIVEPLKRCVIPVIPALAYSPTLKLSRVSAVDVMTALTRALSGSMAMPPAEAAQDTLSIRKGNFLLDRIIILDPLGGIPSRDRHDGAHVYINLAQEFDDIVDELSEYTQGAEHDTMQSNKVTSYKQHQQNLIVAKECLALLPSASSALIITPEEAAHSAHADRTLSLGAGTRRQKNTLIHNLLTNKPMISSSLPTARLTQSNPSDNLSTLTIPTSTLIKRGMPVTIIPAADRLTGWQPPSPTSPILNLETDPRIDLPRLVNLIDDSFRRRLDTRAYLDRIAGRVAGIIVAGDYEGGAILTWELAPPTPDGRSSEPRYVPYLDKFAVLQSSQGSAGVADVVFQAMVRSCFPHGVCWRSRKDNPVNKWYFERAAGSWLIPESNWTMFWTGEGVVEDKSRWEDHVGVCRSVVPTWADAKKPD